MKEDEQNQLKDLSEHVRKVILHPANFDDLYEGYKGSELDLPSYIKSKLYPGYKPKLKTSYGSEISECWQEKAWLGLDLDQICDVLAEDSDAKEEDKGVLQVIKKEHIKSNFYEMIRRGLQELLLEDEIILLNPKDEQFLMGTYIGGKQTLAEHIMFQVYPNGFFPLKGIDVPEEAQKKILALLKPMDVAYGIDEHSDSWSPNCNIREFFEQEQIITELRDTVAFSYWGGGIVGDFG